MSVVAAKDAALALVELATRPSVSRRVEEAREAMDLCAALEYTDLVRLVDMLHVIHSTAKSELSRRDFDESIGEYAWRKGLVRAVDEAGEDSNGSA